MKKRENNFFWPSFADLMTNLFFIMLVLYVLTFISLQNTIRDLQGKQKVYDQVEQNLKPLQNDTALFHYEPGLKRFTLAFDVAFERGESEIAVGKLVSYEATEKKIHEVGLQLKHTVERLAEDQLRDPDLKKVSWLLIVSGSSSHLASTNQFNDYELSYKRAYNLWSYWKTQGINFEAPVYESLIDLQIAGNGWGGVGRFAHDSTDNFQVESRNQRFIIQIVPKIGNTSAK